MGTLLKFILFGIVIYYIIRKVSGFILRIMGGNPTPNNQQKYTKEGDVHVDYVPKDKKGKFGDDFKGGEYVDYEEVK